ncbi:hypothetical protein E1A91_A03G086500v1 [Gossypium mustelinum]|uniref:Uncharacterized protein n=1 Tax=Gossypium mustelinum TaxID=34275 RepID=A0A5D2ZXJ5_GOSMU|nr:hypothetical protein E1A91_A03G086500v1 [Gossypium mustelinum]TYJ42392.1 hypothetical protein E1A91_A03G086500v1 [Gossypium mustelinum]TYJ42393.1 hypothetical protein E1A91_A03G086500v1 [Gossypium mustelinum]
MPGNEVGDRIHNFLGGESLSQGQHHSQVFDGTWSGLNNNQWVGSQRQVGGHLVSSLKNFSLHQLADADRGQSGQSSSLQHGLNFTQSGLRPESVRSQSQNQSSNVNGYMQGHQAFQTRQNETNFLGVDTASRGPDLHKKNPMRLDAAESPVNYDFFGGQQQINGQHHGMIQPLPRQQAERTDMQLLQQHAMLKKMQELQRQQLPNSQFQLPEARQLSSVNQVSSVVKQGSDSVSLAPINGVPVHNASNYSWQTENMNENVNANWLQDGATPIMQGSSSGFLFSPEQGQVHLMGLVPRQVDQSFYGISTSGPIVDQYQYSSVQMDEPLMQQVQASSNSFPGNQYAMFQDQVSLQDGSLVSGQGDLGKNVLGAAAGQGLNNGFLSENLQQMTILPKNAVMQESSGRQGHPGPSETSLRKSSIQADPPQAVATLDPTEEKILFGSDDSVWDMFGKSANMGSVLDGMVSSGAFPSLQSGSWSALMQSAVAETPSNDIGIQEEWSGLGMQHNEPASGNMPSSIVNYGSKQESAWADNNFLPASTLNSKPSPMSQRFVKELTEDSSKRLGCSSLRKHVAESAKSLGNASHSPGMQVTANSISGHQQGLAIHSPHGQPQNEPNGWKSIDTASHGVGTISKSQDIQRSLQPSQNSDQRGAMYKERGHSSGFDLRNIKSGNVNSGLGSLQVNGVASDLDNFAEITDKRTTRVTKESSQQLPNSRNLHLWKSVDSQVNRGLSRVPVEYQQIQERSPENLDSSGNNCLDKGASGVNVSGDLNVKETSNDSFCSNLPQYTSTGGTRDNVWLDVNDLQGGKQKSSAHISHKSSVTRKFQYHPMGDLDVEIEPSYGTKSVAHSRATSQHVSQGLKGHDKGYSGQSQLTGHAGGEATEVEKGCFPGVKVDKIPSKSSNPGSAPDRSFGGFVPKKTYPTSQNILELFQKADPPKERGTATRLSSSEHNQSSEMPDAETSDGSVGQFQHNKPIASQGFGLQLGLPSQKFTIPDRAISLQSFPQGVNSPNLVHGSSEEGRKGHTWLDTIASVQSLTHGASHGDRSNVSSVSGQTSNKASQNTMEANVSAGFTSYNPHSKSHLQSQHVSSVGSQGTPKEYVNAPFGVLASQMKQTDDSSVRAQASQGRKSAPCMPKTAPGENLASSEASWPSSSNEINARGPGQHFPVLEASLPSTTSESSQGAFTKNMPNLHASVSAPQHLLGAQSALASQNLFKPNHQSNIKSEASHPGSKKLDDQIAQVVGSGRSEFPADCAKLQSFVGEKPPANAQQVLRENDASQNLAAMQRDIEAFGRSLRPNNAANQNTLLLHQVQALENVEIDPSNRSVKRFKGPDSGLDAQLVGSHGQEEQSYGSSTVMGDAAVNFSSDPSGNSKMPRFSSNTGDDNERRLSSSDMLASSQNDSQHFPNANNPAAVLKGEHSQISPQMAPFWFDRYGMFKNGQMLPVYDAQKLAMMKATEKIFTVGRPPDSLHPLHSSEQVNAAASQLDNAQQSSNLLPVASDHFSPHSLCPDLTNQSLVVVRAKKRKSMTFELLSWHREVTQGPQKPQNISVAEAEWAHAVNRLIEKVEDEPETIEEWSPVLRTRRRLILTTQLMQQLLRAPPRVVFSTDASKNHETVAYFVARSVLGDACCTSYVPESDTADPPDGGCILSEKLKEEKNESILKAAEEIIVRTKKLENYLQSLDKRASILDLRIECQDLGKASVINRFAKFHSRGQGDGAETSSSYAITSSYKFFPHRYVTALPMPRNLPDRVQCHSL